MTRKQLQLLISAGVFSAALLSGVAYADDAGPNSSAPAPAASGSATNQPPATANAPRLPRVRRDRIRPTPKIPRGQPKAPPITAAAEPEAAAQAPVPARRNPLNNRTCQSAIG